MSHPLVSIVVCTYNGERWLRAQLESLIAQTYPNLEIIIADDRSTDGTRHIIEEYRARDSRIKSRVNPHNLGYNRNFEQAFRYAQGDLIAISDQDDIWRNDKISRMISLFSDTETVLAHCQSARFRETIPDIQRQTARRLFEGNDVRKMMFFNTVAGHNIIFRKELLRHAEPFPDNVFYDWWLTIVAAIYGRVRATDEVLTYHRYHDANVTLGKKDERKQTRAKAEERLHTVQQLLKLDGLDTEQKEFGRELLSALQSLEGKSFSFPLFSFLLQNAGIVFFFKKKSFLSRLKMAWRMSFAVE